MKVRAAIFDIGNVLLKFNYFIAAERLKLINNLAELPDRQVIVDAKNDLEHGKIKRRDFLDIAMKAFRHEGDEESFLDIWRDIFHPNHPMVEFARSLSQQLPTYLLSNISCIHQEHIFQRYEFFSIFRDGAYSYRLRCMKPDEKIYRMALAQFRLRPEEVVFFDDLPENVETARRLGWQAVQYDFREHGKFLEQAAVLGLTPNLAQR